MKYVIPIIYFLLGLYCVLNAQDFTFNHVRTIVLHESVERAHVKGAAWVTENGLRLEINGEAHAYQVDRASQHGPRTIITTRCGALIQVFTRNERIDRIVVNEGAATTILENYDPSAVVQDDVIILRSGIWLMFGGAIAVYLLYALVRFALHYQDKYPDIYEEEIRRRAREDDDWPLGV